MSNNEKPFAVLNCFWYFNLFSPRLCILYPGENFSAWELLAMFCFGLLLRTFYLWMGKTRFCFIQSKWHPLSKLDENYICVRRNTICASVAYRERGLHWLWCVRCLHWFQTSGCLNVFMKTELVQTRMKKVFPRLELIPVTTDTSWLESQSERGLGLQSAHLHISRAIALRWGLH